LPAPEPKISVVICTYNRENFLRKVLLSLVEQTLNQALYEVLIINNNSTDNTQAVAEEFVQRYKNIKVFNESEQGLSHARNRGWKESKGEIIVFLDDDAVACKDWLESYLEVFENHKPDCAGGRIEIEWETERPKWLSDTFLKFLGHLDLSDTPQALTKPSLFGGNLAIRKEILQEINGFNTDMGRGKSDLAGNEEIELQNRLINSGKTIYYSPNSKIYHFAASSRLKLSWFIKRSYWQGVSDAKMYKFETSLKPNNKFKVTLNILYLLKNIFVNILRRNSDKTISDILNLSRELGYFITN